MHTLFRLLEFGKNGLLGRSRIVHQAYQLGLNGLRDFGTCLPSHRLNQVIRAIDELRLMAIYQLVATQLRGIGRSAGKSK